jgi:hypothetical protein
MHISKSLLVFIYLKLIILFYYIFICELLMFLLLLCVWLSINDLVKAAYGVNEYDARYIFCKCEVWDQQNCEFKLKLLRLLVRNKSGDFALAKPKVEPTCRNI